MALIDHDNIMREAVCTWELFRTFGYPATEIFFNSNEREEGGFDITMSIEHEGRSVGIRIGEVPYNHEEIVYRWTVIGTEWKAASNEERMELFNNSQARKQASIVIINFQMNGFGVTPDQVQEFRDKHRELH